MAKVSIVMATWNRSNIIGYAIQSVLRQTHQDWELLVIGDHCTDDTAEVVAAFNDSRISFHNLPENFGEQSRPNNVGITKATGDYCAFLNHDDFWFEDHLETCIRTIGERGADIAIGPMLVYQPDKPPHTSAVTRSGGYDALADFPVTTWCFRRDVWDAVGPFRPAVELYSYPSYEWIWRANRCKQRMLCNPHFTTLKIASIARKNMYKDRLEADHAYCHQQLVQTDNFREQLLDEHGRYHGASMVTLARLSAIYLKRFVRNLTYGIFAAIGIPPLAAKNFLLYRRKAGFLNDLRRQRGLDNLRNQKG